MNQQRAYLFKGIIKAVMFFDNSLSTHNKNLKQNIKLVNFIEFLIRIEKLEQATQSFLVSIIVTQVVDEIEMSFKPLSFPDFKELKAIAQNIDKACDCDCIMNEKGIFATLKF